MSSGPIWARRLAVNIACLLVGVLLWSVLATPLAEGASWSRFQTKHFEIYIQKKNAQKEISRIAEESFLKITREVDYSPPRRIVLFVYSSQSDFEKVSPGEDVLGFADPFGGRIYVLQSSRELASVVRHELSHVAFLQSVPHPTKIPFWFIEGLAVYQSEPFEASVEIQRRALRGDLKSVSELGKVRPATTEEEEKVTAEGYLLVEYIVEQFGKGKLKELSKNLQAGDDFSLALRKSTGRSERELNKMWQTKLRRERTALILEGLRNTGLILLGLLALLGLVVILRRKRELRKEYEQGEEEEGKE